MASPSTTLWSRGASSALTGVAREEAFAIADKISSENRKTDFGTYTINELIITDRDVWKKKKATSFPRSTTCLFAPP